MIIFFHLIGTIKDMFYNRISRCLNKNEIQQVKGLQNRVLSTLNFNKEHTSSRANWGVKVDRNRQTQYLVGRQFEYAHFMIYTES